MRHWLSAAAVCVLLAIAHTWPLATDPGTLSRNDTADAHLNEWILAWVAHELPRNPAGLFDANIFYPSRDVLAFSEPLIVPGAMGAPLAWAGASPVLVYNLMLMAGFALTALAGYRLMHAWTGDRAAALLTGSMFAFNTHTMTRLAHIQGIHLYGLPLALLAADRLLTGARTRDALWLALWMSVLVYTSGYTAVFGIFMIGAALVARVPEWWGARAAPVLGRFALAGAAATAAAIPVYLPYRRVAIDQGMVRAIESVDLYSATLNHYLAAAGRVHAAWSQPFFDAAGDGYFPGVLVLALGAVALWQGLRPGSAPSGDVPAVTREQAPPALTRARIRMLLLIAAVGVLLSLGTHTPLYGWLFDVFPPIRGMRAASRFGTLFVLAFACLAGLGLAYLGSARAPGARRAAWMPALAAAIVLVANLESLAAPIGYYPFAGIPEIYARLATEPGPVVLVEIPLYRRSQISNNSPYVLASTRHWQKLVNGYSGYVPAEYREFAQTFRGFPAETPLDAMRKAGITHVMVHPARFPANAAAVMGELAGNPAFELLAEGPDGMKLYRLH
jgi:hypothetical protein